MNIAHKTSVFALFFLVTNAATAQSTNDREAVKAVLENFVGAYVTDDAEIMRKAFRSDGVMVGYSTRNKAVVIRNGDEFAKGFTREPAADEAQRKSSFEILDITNSGAVAKVILDYPTWDGIDYLSLAKIDGEWKIISKSWHGQVKPKPKG
jgi:Putative lumazine-binding